jgi:hypothetical protein
MKRNQPQNQDWQLISRLTTMEQSTQQTQQHTAIVLFYKYFVCLPDKQQSLSNSVDVTTSANKKWLYVQRYSDYYIDKIQDYIKNVCTKLQLKGRIITGIGRY